MGCKKILCDAGIAVCIVLTIVMAAFLLAFFAGWDRSSPLQYYEADRAEPSAGGTFQIPVHNLTGEDVARHPVFHDLLSNRKKILYSLRPGQVVPVIREQCTSHFNGGKQFGLTILSDREDAYLSEFDMHVVSFEGKYYYIRKEGNRSVAPCGRGMQC